MIKKIFYFLKGYLLVCADSKFVERFINVCMHRDILIDEIKRYGSNRITFITDIKSFFNIRIPARRTKTSVKIIKRCGLPFLVKKYKKRRILIFCGTIVLISLWYASTHVLGITVFGNNRISTDLINSTISDCGIKIGMKTSDISSNTVRNKMMNKLPDLAWVGINANGSRVYIEIVERIEKIDGVDKNAPACDLVAKCDGEVEKLNVREGQSVVEIGSGVRKGDVLVSGIVDNPINGFTYVHSRGEVIAKTRYTKTRSLPLNYTENYETGNNKSRFVLSINEKSIPLYKSIPYATYETEEKELKIPNLFGTLPDLSIKKVKYKEIYKENKTLSPTDAVNQAKDELFIELKNELCENTEIIDRKVTYTLSEKNEVIVTMELICRENIANEYIIEVPAE